LNFIVCILFKCSVQQNIIVIINEIHMISARFYYRLNVCGASCMLCELYVVRVVCSATCMCCELYVVRVVCSASCMLCELYVVRVVCCASCMLCELYVLRFVKKVIYNKICGVSVGIWLDSSVQVNVLRNIKGFREGVKIPCWKYTDDEENGDNKIMV